MLNSYSDSYDVIRDFNTFEEDRAAYAELLNALPEGVSNEAKEMLMQHTDWSLEQEEAWGQLKDACEAHDSHPDWLSGTQLIPAADFNGGFAEELCSDLGYLPRSGLPSFIAIDWNATAENLKANYSLITICEEDYYIRS
jgi:hypothetical protein